jgi:hypothetical protein
LDAEKKANKKVVIKKSELIRFSEGQVVRDKSFQLRGFLDEIRSNQVAI